MFKIKFFNEIFFNINSSIFSYLRYRQLLLFLYILFLLIITYLFTTTFLYYYFGNLLYVCYTDSSSSHLFSSSAPDILLSSFLGNFFHNYNVYICSLYDEYMLYFSYISNVGEYRKCSHLLSYGFNAWHETCDSCGGRGSLGASYYSNSWEVLRYGVSTKFNNVFLDFGSFTVLKPLYSNAVCSQSNFILNSPYLSEDNGVLKIIHFYGSAQVLFSSYLNSIIFFDNSFSGLIRWSNCSIFDIESLDFKFSSSGKPLDTYTKSIYMRISGRDLVYNQLCLHRVVSDTKYDVIQITTIDNVVDNFVNYFKYFVEGTISGEMVAPFIFKYELLGTTVGVADSIYHTLCLYGRVCNTLFNSNYTFNVINAIRDVCSDNLLQKNRINKYGAAAFYNTVFESFNADAIVYCHNSYDNKIKSLQLYGMDPIHAWGRVGYCLNYAYNMDNLLSYIGNNLYSRGDNIYLLQNYRSDLHNYTHRFVNHLGGFLYSSVDESFNVYNKYIHLSSVYNLHTDLNSMLGNFDFTSYAYLNDVCLHLFTRYSSNLFVGYNSTCFSNMGSNTGVSMDTVKIYNNFCIRSYNAVYSTLFSFERDYVYDITLDNVRSVLPDVSNYSFEFYKFGNYSGVCSCYGYGIHKALIFGEDYNYNSKFSFLKLQNESIISSLFGYTHSTGVCSDFVTSYDICRGILLFVKFFCILYPFVFISIFFLLLIHVLYSFEFLLNDYVECVEFRRCIMYILLLILYIYSYTCVFSVFIADFFGLQVDLVNGISSTNYVDIFTIKYLNMLNIDEEFVNILLYYNFVEFSSPYNNIILSILYDILYIAGLKCIDLTLMFEYLLYV